MDHAALTALRQHLPPLHASATPTHSPSLAPARRSAASLPAAEVLRELHRLPPGPARISVLTALASHIPLFRLRLAALTDPILLHPAATSHHVPAPQPYVHAVAVLSAAWAPLVAHDEAAARALSALRAAYGVSAEATVAVPVASPVESFRAEAESLSEAVAAMHTRLEEAAALLGDADVFGHDGLVEHVADCWASVRARRREMAELRARLTTFAEDARTAQRDRLQAGELAQRLDEDVRALHRRRTALREKGFDVREVTPGPREEESSSEGEWEDVVEVAVENVVQEEAVLPQVADWASVMRGEEGREVNRLILERFERQSVPVGIDHRYQGAGAGNGTLQGNGADGQRGPARGRGSGKRRQPSTAKERLSKKLGIKKKRKKRSLLDGD